MNTLSWLIYLAQVSSSLGAFFSFIGFCALLGWLAIPSIRWLYWNVDFSREDKTWQRLSYAWLAFAICFCLLGDLMPTQNTVLAIAASQVGENIAMNKDVQGITGDATKALQAWIHRQLDPPKKDSH